MTRKEFLEEKLVKYSKEAQDCRALNDYKTAELWDDLSTMALTEKFNLEYLNAF